MSEIRASEAEMVLRWEFNLSPEDAEMIMLLLGFLGMEGD